MCPGRRRWAPSRRAPTRCGPSRSRRWPPGARRGCTRRTPARRCRHRRRRHSLHRVSTQASDQDQGDGSRNNSTPRNQEQKLAISFALLPITRLSEGTQRATRGLSPKSRESNRIRRTEQRNVPKSATGGRNKTRFGSL